MDLNGLDIPCKIQNDVCDVCNKNHPEWAARIDDQLKATFPVWLEVGKGIPANHPVWETREKLWAEYKVKCLCFAYDDWTLALCSDHLHELGKALLPFRRKDGFPRTNN